jgi:DNA polymerase
MRILSIDLETFCVTDIKTAGAYKYAEKAEILLFGYKWDDGPVHVIDFTQFWDLGMHPSEYLPLDVWEALPDEHVLKTAWNCAFERSVMQKFFGIELPPEQWKDTMVTAAMCGLPLSLGEAAKALNMEQEKDNAGKALIRFFSIPCKPTKANGMRTRNLPEHAPEKWAQFISYCGNDVTVETEIAKKLEWYKIPDTERKLWFLDQKKNARGIKVNMVLIEQAIKMDKIFRDRLIKEASEITGLGNVNSVAQLRGWLKEETGDAVDSLAKNNVTKLIVEVDSAKAKRVLEIRALMAKSSIKKYLAMKNAAGVGDRIRGMIQYYGAQRTGREAGRLAQPQNFPRISDEFEEFLDLARELVKAGDLEGVEFMFGDEVPNILSQLLRTTFIADEGKEFIVLDFSAIEMVCASWVAREQWRLDVFNKGGDIYKASASAMFKIPVEQVTKDQRQKGKISELLCGYGGTKPAMERMNETIVDPKKRIAEKEMTPLIKAWREANSNIVSFWWAIGKAAISCVKTGQWTDVDKGISFEMKKGNLMMNLPAGRSLCYPGAHLRKFWVGTVDKVSKDEDGNYVVETVKVKLPEVKLGTNDEFRRFMREKGLKQKENVDPTQRDTLCFWGPNSMTKKWEVMETHGARLFENSIQAISRDCLMFAVMNMEKAGGTVCLTVHDELVLEVPKGKFTYNEVKDIMTITPPWAKGLDLRADGFIGTYYKK